MVSGKNKCVTSNPQLGQGSSDQGCCISHLSLIAFRARTSCGSECCSCSLAYVLQHTLYPSNASLTHYSLLITHHIDFCTHISRGRECCSCSLAYVLVMHPLAAFIVRSCQGKCACVARMHESINTGACLHQLVQRMLRSYTLRRLRTFKHLKVSLFAAGSAMSSLQKRRTRSSRAGIK